MKAIIRYTFLTAIRDRLFVGIFISALLGMSVAGFLGGLALVEEHEMMMAYAGAVSRIVIVVGLILFVCFHVRRSFDTREIEVMLSRPISRTAFILSYWLAFVVVTLAIIIPVGLVFLGMIQPSMEGFFYWLLSLFLESAIVTAFAMIAALILRSAVTAIIATFAFYIMGRMMAFLTFMLHFPSTLPKSSSVMQWLEIFLQLIATLFPRLDMFGKSTWLVYGMEHPSDIQNLLLQAAVYIPFALAVAVYDFRRKQF